jgi:hypothetical protein
MKIIQLYCVLLAYFLGINTAFSVSRYHPHSYPKSLRRRCQYREAHPSQKKLISLTALKVHGNIASSSASVFCVDNSECTLNEVNHGNVLIERKPLGLVQSIWNEYLQVPFYLTIWYSGNVLYNLFNKHACNALGKDIHGHCNAHWTLSAVQVKNVLAFFSCCNCGRI